MNDSRFQEIETLIEESGRCFDPVTPEMSTGTTISSPHESQIEVASGWAASLLRRRLGRFLGMQKCS